MKRNHITIPTCLILIFFIVFTACSGSHFLQSQEQIINNASIPVLKQEKIYTDVLSIDQIDIKMDIFEYENGIYVTTASVLDEDQKQNLDLNQMIEQILVEKAKVYDALNIELPVDISLPYLSDFSLSSVSDENQNCIISQQGQWYGHKGLFQTSAGIGSFNVSTLYAGETNAEKIIISSSRIYCSGLGLQTTSTGALTTPSDLFAWRSSEYENITYMSVDFPGYIAAKGWFGADITVHCVAEIQAANSQGFVIGVQSTNSKNS